jgi:hypothetical protein
MNVNEGSMSKFIVPALALAFVVVIGFYLWDSTQSSVAIDNRSATRIDSIGLKLTTGTNGPDENHKVIPAGSLDAKSKLVKRYSSGDATLSILITMGEMTRVAHCGYTSSGLGEKFFVLVENETDALKCTSTHSRSKN